MRIFLLHPEQTSVSFRPQDPPKEGLGFPEERLPLGVGGSDLAVDGGEEVEGALEGLEAQLLQRLRLHRLHLDHRPRHRPPPPLPPLRSSGGRQWLEMP